MVNPFTYSKYDPDYVSSWALKALLHVVKPSKVMPIWCWSFFLSLICGALYLGALFLIAVLADSGSVLERYQQFPEWVLIVGPLAIWMMFSFAYHVRFLYQLATTDKRMYAMALEDDPYWKIEQAVYNGVYPGARCAELLFIRPIVGFFRITMSPLLILVILASVVNIPAALLFKADGEVWLFVPLIYVPLMLLIIIIRALVVGLLGKTARRS